ncbi:hypothetical protein [Leptothoe sp. PORK10 BA2]|uniref:hypothetical protein n=1 Tax=Leptothoe sp. PORK10 BA2 TaxID=3110254 RepID=UPI002B210DC8|nr:hypothetical protein [Leptothoe sp. PORK10 BA2]MEA5464617.1 hypothetical protein [Leptothoe sp. PORK10 BA2]
MTVLKSPQIHDEHVLVAMIMSPIRGGQRAYRHLSSVRGFGIIASMMTVYCAGLSIESLMVSMPATMRSGDYAEVARGQGSRAALEAIKRERRFIPKPYVNDGAKLGRLNPWPNIQRTILQNYFQWLPLWIKGRVASDYWTVWNQPGILVLSVVFALTIQRFEGMIWRKKTPDETLAEFEEANALEAVEADPRAIALAAYKAGQHNAQGLGGIIGTFIAVVLLYGLEIAAFAGSFAGAGNWVINTIYAGLNIFGFEIFDRMGDDQ